jgi:hypothetical protein
MGAAEFVIPLAGLVIPIGLILLAVLVDILALVWYGFVVLREKWHGHIVAPIRGMGVHRPA